MPSRRRRSSDPLLVLLLALWLLPGGHGAAAAETNGRSPWEASLVTLEVTYKAYDYFQPWTKPSRSVRKQALVTGERQVLTTAQYLADSTLVRLQRGGRGTWYNARVLWRDDLANLALVTSDEEAAWTGLRPAEIPNVAPRRAQMEILRWRDGNLETRRADFSKFMVAEGTLSYAPRLQLELNTEIDGLGWAEPVLADGRVAGLTSGKGGNVCSVIPASFIRQVLEAHRAAGPHQLGYFDFTWEPGANPATLDFLKLAGEPRGALVIHVPRGKRPEPVLRERDLILEVEGFPIDVQGDYDDPDYGHLMLENLATRGEWAGDDVRLKVWRDGDILDLNFPLPVAAYTNQLVPEHSFDQSPEHLIAGGLVFQPLLEDYLSGWGDDWERRAPFRLLYYRNQDPTPERPGLIVLGAVLPDPFNLGYQDARFLVVDQVNGRKIGHLGDLKEALRQPQEGVHQIEFMKGEALQRMVLDAAGLEAATRRILERYGIQEAEVIAAN